MADVPATSIAGNIIITPDMVPPAAEPLETQAAHYAALAEKVGELQQQLKAANAMREEAAQSPGWEAGHEKNRQLAADYGRMVEIYNAAADYFNGVAGVYRDAQTAQRNVLMKANAELSQAKNAIQQQEIAARWHTHARALTTSAVGAATAKAGVFEHTAGTDITALTSRLGGPAPQDPVLPHSGGGGIAVPTGKEGSGLGDDNGDPANPNGTGNPQGIGNGHTPRHSGAAKGEDGEPATTGPGSTPAVMGSPYPGAGQMPMPGGGGSGIQSVGFPPGLTSMTGGLGSMPGGGGMGGLGSGGGLGGLPGGMGQLPGTQAAGLGNLPANAAPAAGAPAQLGPAFSQGLSAGSALGSLPPATGTGTPAAGQAAATPAAGLTSGAGVPSAGLTGAGATPPAVSPAAPGLATSGGPTSAAPAAMMLPPPGMGAPAAPVAAGGASAAAPVAPAGNTATPGGSAPTTGPAAGSTVGSGGAVVVPASVVSAGAGARNRGRPESAELATAKVLARKLRRDSDIVNYACIEWAVGVFRREAGGATECVVMSNEGFGYIPRGVFLPRTARLLTADKLVDNQFREGWFGSSDPAEVLAEYARLRGRGGTHLVAMAVTADSPYGRVPGVEYAVCQREFDDGAYIRPILDDMHMHRLEALHPEVYARVQQTTSTEPETRMVENQVVVPLAVQMIEAVKMSGEMTLDLRQMWDVLGTGDHISEEVWNQYRIASTVYYVNLSANRPRPEASTGDRERYQAQWVTARTMELLQGWERRPVDVADMVYAAATAYPWRFWHQI
ncbi:hypothetical protein U8D42_26060 [Mycobacterium europaeum]|uniref:Methyl-accepting chemotaxis sensory transducer n=11 Tax=Mycobacteriaceae TaxID=1762 RepID=D5P1N5_9MYCO|nr:MULTISPECIES: hypothetical protein [Mycobacterium]ETZ68482.1 hypothetical protein L841_1877 [Mycobacterium sp. MAC_080597_8934]KRQ21613.1 hypothetical protein AOT87_16010 [Mycobacteroides sp. H003]KRQ37603.1 hypothetical protein AOT92_21285 [Mycobacteroides sp. H101]KRQ42831.1 hypothetical protein AOT88_25065 [Mycobacteroides sp. H063]KRQ59966.1 hypothetical protein AOT90_21700 [Mycobacteroides sp. H079]KRQ63780.1 hypothetical protein AOT94_00195 [Mycobacteroides sp. HXVII]KRQ81819.1 hypo